MVYQTFAAHTGRFQSIYFFPYCVSQWNNLDGDLRDMTLLSSFKSALSLIKFIRPNLNPIYNIHNSAGVLLLNRLWVGFSHRREHKFRYNFLDTINPFCDCRSNAIETTKHLLHSLISLLNEKLSLTTSTRKVYRFCLIMNFISLFFLLFCMVIFDDVTNMNILNNIINCITSSKRFSVTLFS